MALLSLTTTPFISQQKPHHLSSSSSSAHLFQSKTAKSLFGYRLSCRKEGIHPEFYEDAKVYCNGELVMTTGGTQKDYSVDVWSGNHPFYLGNRSALLIDADQVEKFRKKYGEMGKFMEIPNLKYGEIVLPTRKKAPAKGKGKK